MTRAFEHMNTFRGEERRGETIRARSILGRRENEAILNRLVTGGTPFRALYDDAEGMGASDEQLVTDIAIGSEVRALQMVVGRPLIAGAQFE